MTELLSDADFTALEHFTLALLRRKKQLQSNTELKNSRRFHLSDI